MRVSIGAALARKLNAKNNAAIRTVANNSVSHNERLNNDGAQDSACFGEMFDMLVPPCNESDEIKIRHQAAGITARYLPGVRCARIAAGPLI
jgi:hypothetical protein